MDGAVDGAMEGAVEEPRRSADDANHPRADESWRVRLFAKPAPDEPPLGAGVLLTDELILTCAHVVTEPGTQEPLAAVYANFPLAGEKRGLFHLAKVVPQYWQRTAGGSGSPQDEVEINGDVALLRLDQPVPGAQARPTALHRGNHSRPLASDLVVFTGYTPTEPGGKIARTHLLGYGGHHFDADWVQLDRHLESRVWHGCSGAGVVRVRNGQVLGVITAGDPRARSGSGYRRCWMIPTETVLERLPGLPDRGVTVTGIPAVPTDMAPRPPRPEPPDAPGLRSLVTGWLKGRPDTAPVEVVFVRDETLPVLRDTLGRAGRALGFAVGATRLTAQDLATRMAGRAELLDPLGPEEALAHDRLLAEIAAGPGLASALLLLDEAASPPEEIVPLLRRMQQPADARLLLAFRDPESAMYRYVAEHFLGPEWTAGLADRIGQRIDELAALETRLARHGSARHGSTRHGSAEHDSARHGSARRAQATAQSASGSTLSGSPPEPHAGQLRTRLAELRGEGGPEGPDGPRPDPRALFQFSVDTEGFLRTAETLGKRLDNPFTLAVTPPAERGTELPAIMVSNADSLVALATRTSEQGPRPGEILHEQYQIIGPLGSGRHGRVYLARDLELGNLVALKLHNPEDPAAVWQADVERRRLVNLKHPAIVRVINYATYQPNSSKFLVLEFAEGAQLEWVKGRFEAGDPRFPADRIHEFVARYGLLVLDPLRYLHTQEKLVYGDLSLANILHCRDGIKLIDVASVREFGARGPVSYRRPELPPDEKDDGRMGPSGDLYCLGRVLKDLLPTALSTPSTASTHVGAESLQRVLDRATAPEPEARFADAQEMADQLHGVLRELRSLRLREETFEPSRHFDQASSALDGGLGDAPPLHQWAHGDERKRPLKARPPEPREAAAALPAPKAARDDANWKHLQRTSYRDPESLLQLSEKWAASPERSLLRCRLYIQLAHEFTPDPAPGKQRRPKDTAWRTPEASLEQARAQLAAARREIDVHGNSAHDWRVPWHEALIELSCGRVAAALARFTKVYEDIPGEYAPKLALGYCHEKLGHHRQAAKYYHAVWCRNHAQGGAAFGLARILLAYGIRRLALESLEAVPADSGHRTAARIAMVRIQAGRPPEPGATEGEFTQAVADFARAWQSLHWLAKHEGLTDARARERIRTDLLELLLALAEHEPGRERRAGRRAGRRARRRGRTGPSDSLLWAGLDQRVRHTPDAATDSPTGIAPGITTGLAPDMAFDRAFEQPSAGDLAVPRDEDELRRLLSDTYRTLAEQAPHATRTPAEAAALAESLLDNANRVRPPGWFHHFGRTVDRGTA
ncbi:tetratricopeptide repeat protein [Streptomyces monticola]|uniref:non-specific serine/threonine protein kinase n=1 Tax=Streptomyces monticola TaxID=2666263 RepID=A0ABW2JLU0_9ACTN